MLGYVKKLPEECFDEDGFFHTGDWIRRRRGVPALDGPHDGDDQDRRRQRVAGRDRETLLRHPGLKSALAVGIPDEKLGEMVVCAQSRMMGWPSTRVTCATSCAGGWPRTRFRRVLFFDEDELSLTGSSKIRGDALRKLAMQRLSVERDDLNAASAKPRAAPGTARRRVERRSDRPVGAERPARADGVRVDDGGHVPRPTLEVPIDEAPDGVAIIGLDAGGRDTCNTISIRVAWRGCMPCASTTASGRSAAPLRISQRSISRSALPGTFSDDGQASAAAGSSPLTGRPGSDFDLVYTSG